MTRIYKCDYCGKEDTAAADEYRLQKCTGCNKNLYCSRECQKLDWPSHKNRCRRKANDADMLVVHDKQVLDIDRVLSYASRYMQNLKHVSITLNKYYEVGNNTNMISRDELKSFLKSNKGQLDSIRVDMMMNMMIERKCVWMCSTLTNGGEIWTELHGLKLLDMLLPVFGNCNELVKVINQQQRTIESLGLICIRLGLTKGTRNDWSNIAQSISKCRRLVRLNLNQNLLRDSDMEVLLSSLPNLKILTLCGPRCTGAKRGNLTDKTCKIVSKMCPGLREIDLSGHEKVTLAGIKRVLKSCQYLRKIRTSMVLSRTDVIGMLNLAPNLIELRFKFCFDAASFGELIETTCGSVTFSDVDDRSERKVTGVSKEAYTKYLELHKLLEVYQKNVDNPKVIDEWAFLDDLKV